MLAAKELRDSDFKVVCVPRMCVETATRRRLSRGPPPYISSRLV